MWRSTSRAWACSRTASAARFSAVGLLRFSLLRGGLRVGADFFSRVGALRPELPAPRGLVEELADLARPGVDVHRMDPRVAAFFLDPCSLALRVQSHWHGVFSLAWRALRPALGWVGQLYLPLDRAEVRVRTLALDPARDGREDVRGVVRSYLSGEVMQVMAYATHRDETGGYMSAAIPLPYGTLCGVLSLSLLGDGEGAGAKLTTRRTPGTREPVGLWFAPRWGPAFRVPLEETLELWPADAREAPSEARAMAREGDTILGRHAQLLAGLRFATHHYAFSPL